MNRWHINSLGGQSVLTSEEKKILVEGVLQAAHWSFPLTKKDIRFIVKGYLERYGHNKKRFHRNLPGVEWVTCFLKRFSKTLSTRLSENMKRIEQM